MFTHFVRTRLEDWSVRTQLHARRNAMVAATAITQRVNEAREVEEFLRNHHRRGTQAIAIQAQPPHAPALRHA